jgi:hypothetical protein
LRRRVLLDLFLWRVLQLQRLLLELFRVLFELLLRRLL